MSDPPDALVGEHMPLEEVITWLDTNGRWVAFLPDPDLPVVGGAGAFIIIDEVDGQEACRLDMGADGCECHCHRTEAMVQTATSNTLAPKDIRKGTTSDTRCASRMNQRAADEGFEHCQWVGADDIAYSFPIDLSDLPSEDGVIGILVHKAGAADENLFGYSPMTRATRRGAKPDEYETDDIHVSLPQLCEDYGLPLDLVVDRMAIALLWLAQAEALGKTDDDA